MTESSTSDPAPSAPSDRPASEERKRSPLRILRDLPKFRNTWLSKSISSIGSGVGRIALVLMVAPSGATAVALVLAGNALPMLLGPLAGAVADRVDQRRLLAATEAGQGVIYAALVIIRPPLPALLPLVVLSWDGESHRLALVKLPRFVRYAFPLSRIRRKAYGIDHLAFTYQ